LTKNALPFILNAVLDRLLRDAQMTSSAPAPLTHSFTGFVPADFLEFLLATDPSVEFVTAPRTMSELTPQATHDGPAQRLYHIFFVTLPGFIGVYNAKGYADISLLDAITKSSRAHQESFSRFDFIRIKADGTTYYLSPRRRLPDDIHIGVMLIACSPH
jgi:hypothetical protein